MKRFLLILITVVMSLSLFSFSCVGAPPEAHPIVNPTPQIIAGAVENAIDEIYDQRGLTKTLYFAYSPVGFSSLSDFKAQLSPTLHTLMTSLFAADMVGRDYITVRSSYVARTVQGKTEHYYYTVKLTVHTSKEFRQEMDRLVSLLKDLSPKQQVEQLQELLYESITYDESTLDASGSYLALMEKRSVCMGYSRAFMEICRRLNIPCVALVNDTHMWNSVYVDGAWQMLDVTWNLPLCQEIKQEGHTYDMSAYRLAQYYYQNRAFNRGKAKAAYFTDLEKSWYNTAVEYALGRGMFQGTTTTSFSPDTAMTRGMLVTVLGRLAGAEKQKSAFTDVPSGAYYAGYVGWAAKENIVKGVGGNKFAHEHAVTRQELCKMITGFCGYKNITLPQEQPVLFADDECIERWAKESVYLCRGAGLIKGKGKNKFDPQGETTRAEVGTILYNFEKKFTVY